MPRPRLSLPPLTVIGHRRDGRPIYNIAGGNGQGDGGGSSGGDGSQQQDADGGQGQGSGDSGGAGSANNAKQQGNDTKQADDKANKTDNTKQADTGPSAADLQAKLDESEQARQAQLDAIAKALGLKDDDKAPSAEQLASKVTDLEATNRAQAIELAVLKRSGALGADGSKLTDSRSFIDVVSKLDPSADNFGSKVDDAIKKALEGNSAYRAAPAPPARSGGDFSGGPKTTGKPKSLDAAVSAALAR